MDQISKGSHSLLPSLMPLVVLCVLSLLLWASGVSDFMEGKNLREELGSLQYFVDDHISVSLFLFLVTGVVFGAMGWPRIYTLALLGGFLFGPVVGALSLSVSLTLGALLFTKIVKSGTHKTLSLDVPHGGWVLAAFRLVPFIPFGVTTILSSFLNMSTRRYLLATFMGALPWVALVSLMGGTSLENVTLPEAALASFMDSTSGIVFSLFAVLALVAVLVKMVWKKGRLQVTS